MLRLSSELRNTLTYVLLGVVALLSLGNLVGWAFQFELLVRPHRNSALMQSTTAACCLLITLALYGVVSRRRVLTYASLVLPTVYSVYVIFANGFATPANRMDRLLGDPVFSDAVSVAGRSSTLTATSFLVLVTATIAIERRSMIRAVIGALLAASAIALAAFVLVGYLSGVFYDFGWGAATGVGIITATCISLLAVIIATRGWSEELEVGGAGGRIHPLSAGVAAAAIALGAFLSVTYELREADSVKKQTKIAADAITRDLDGEFDQMLRQVGRMTARLSAEKSTDLTAWQADAHNYVTDIEGLNSIVWINSEGIVGAAQTPSSDHTVERIGEMAVSVASRTTTVIDDMRESGDSFILIVVPFRQGEGGQQWIVLALDIGLYLREHMTGSFWSEFEMSIFHDGRAVYEHTTGNQVNVSGFEAESPLSLFDSRWSVNMVPTVTNVSRQRSHLAEAIMLAGFVVGTLLAISVQLGMRARRHALETDTKNIELENSSARLANLINKIPDAVFIVNADSTIEEANPAAGDMFKKPAEEFVGRKVDDLFPPEVVKSIAVDRRKTGGLDFMLGAVMSIDAVRGNGDEFRAAVTVNGFDTSEGGRFLWIVKDISNELRYEYERRSLTRALEEKNKELESIVYTASHDLRSPLVNMHGFGEELRRSCERLRERLAKDDVPDELKSDVAGTMDQDIPEALGFIKASARKMDRLINGLLKISRLGRVELRMRRLDMNELVAETLSSTRFQLDRDKATVEVGDLPPCIGDQDQLSQVFANLIDNAIKYADPSRPLRLRIHGESKSRDSIYHVEDNGLGIREEYREKVFEIFHRLGADDEGSGEGLGLSIVRRIVDRHNGRIDVEANEPHGTIFTITLPAARQQEIPEHTKRVMHAGVDAHQGARDDQVASS